MKKILEENVSSLKIDKKIKQILVDNEIDTVYDLCNRSRLNLSDMGLTNNQINETIISLQLNGLDLRKNHAKKNPLLDSYAKM